MIAKPWPPGALERLTKLRGESHHTATHIAELLAQEFGVPFTKNSVIGMLHRRKIGRPAVLRKRERAKHMTHPVAPVKPPVPMKAPGTFTIFDLTYHSCRNLYGDGAPYLYCGDQVLAGKAYCAVHYRKNCIPIR